MGHGGESSLVVVPELARSPLTLEVCSILFLTVSSKYKLVEVSSVRNDRLQYFNKFSFGSQILRSLVTVCSKSQTSITVRF